MASRYSLVREIGRGGMGAVWLGRDGFLDREVALKRLGGLPGTHSAATPAVERAAREARLAAALNHANVVSVYDLVEDGESQWLVMEYVEGRSLAEQVSQDGPLDPDAVAAVLSQVADALAAAHGAGIVHRDVKPSNILVTPDGVAKLTDFGIARAEMDEALTQTGQVTGSPAYLSPEVISGRTARPPSDAWSFGATAFHALEGHPPYDVSADLIGALYRIVHEPAPTTDRAGWLAPMLARTMAHEPGDRWSMGQVREFLNSRGERIGSWATSGSGSLPATPAAVVEPAPTTAPVPVAAVAGSHAPPRPTEPPEAPTRGRRGALIALLSVAAVVLIGVLGWLLVTDRDDATQAGGPGTGSATTAGTTDTAEPTTPTATSEDTGEPTDQPSPPTEAAVEEFLRDYVDLAMSQPQEAFARLDTGFQEQSGGYTQWTSWWGRFRSATVSDVRVDDLDNLVATYTVDYEGLNGDNFSATSTVSMIQEPNGDLLIAAEQGS